MDIDITDWIMTVQLPLSGNTSQQLETVQIGWKLQLYENTSHQMETEFTNWIMRVEINIIYEIETEASKLRVKISITLKTSDIRHQIQNDNVAWVKVFTNNIKLNIRNSKTRPALLLENEALHLKTYDVMWCSVLCCDLLWCSVLFYVVMWCSVLCCDVMWYSVLCCDVMWCSVLCCDVI